MSYRSFKRLLGETSLERKCRFLFGAFILVLITLSFWFYALQTEGLAYKQATTTCRLLVNPLFIKDHLQHFSSDGKALEQAWSYNEGKNKDLEELGDYVYHVFVDRPWEFNDPFERDLPKKFSEGDTPTNEVERRLAGDRPKLLFYGAVRANKECINCHNSEGKATKTFSENELAAIVRITMETSAITNAVHINRAFLISIALVTALHIMAGSWIIDR